MKTMKEISGNVFPRQFKKPLPFAVKAKGCWIQDANGNRYLDSSRGP